MDSGFKKIERELKEIAQEKTMLEELNEFLEENKTVTDEVMASMSHELRTPIVAIKAYTDMLLQNKFGELTPEQKQRLEMIQKNTDSLVKAVFDLLEKSQKSNI